MQKEIFPKLVIGLADFLEKRPRSYPYPHAFHYSLNQFSLADLMGYPKTLNGLLNKFEKPVRDWWKGELPTDFDSDEPLIEDKELSFAAMAYLDQLADEDETAFHDSLLKIEIVMDNRKFRQLLKRLREAFLIDPIGAQREYVILRRFIIKEAYTKLVEISQTFSQTHYISVSEVGELYMEASGLADVMCHSDENGNNAFWLCRQCGPLYIKHGQRESLKRSVCGKHCPRQQGWEAITPSRQLQVLRKGIHLRIHLPGLAEIRLLEWLEEQQQKYPQLLLNVSPWPGLDTYDLQIHFVDSIWGVDVKDYKDPHLLGRKLTRLYREGDLYWDDGFYVYPSYRETQRSDYGEVLRAEAGARLKGIQILSDQIFKERVTRKLKSLKKGGN